MKGYRALIISLVVSIALPLSGCSKQGEKKLYRESRTSMDTLVTITVSTESEGKAKAAIEAAFEEIDELERVLSFWTEDSEIAAIYKNAGVKPVRVSPVTRDIVQKALYISNSTEGAFDPTIGPVIRQWDFREKLKPTDANIKKALTLVDYRNVRVEGESVFLKTKGMSFDTGGIAKGYAADRAVEVLKGMGIKAGLVAIAGDIRAFSSRPNGRLWNIGVRNPRPAGEEDDIMATVELENQAISTSGDYERYFELDGVRYHHLLDPKTGYPAEGFISVSIISNSSVLSDGFSTGIFVMGPEKGFKALRREGLEAIMVDKNGEIYITEGLKDRVKLKNPPVIKPPAQP